MNRFVDATVDPLSRAPEHVEPSEELKDRTLRDVALIAGCGGAFRVLYQIAFKPCWSGDSHVYTSMFYLWTQHYYSNSYRPPVYALFLGLVQWLAGQAPTPTMASVYSAVYLQSLLGLVAALAVYASLRVLEVRPRIALAGGLAFSLIGAVCIFELLILTELLSLVTVTLGSCLFLRALHDLVAQKGFRWPALASGLCFSFAILTRPENLVFFTTLVALVMLLCVRCHFLVRVRWATWPLARLALLLVASAAPLVVLWMSWTLLNIGQFRIAIITGVTRTESVYNLFDRVEPKDRVAGALLQKSYLYKNSSGEIYRHHIWFALPELLQAAQLGQLPITPRERTPSNRYLVELRRWLDRLFGLHEHMVANGQVIFQPVDLYDYLGDLSGRLARRYPTVYMRNVLTNFFGDTFRYSYPPPSPAETENPRAPEGGGVVRNLGLYKVALWINWIEAPLLTASYVVLLGYVLFSPLLFFSGREEAILHDGGVFALAVAAFSVVIASCVVAAYYPEHGVSFFGVLVICVCFALHNRGRIKGRIFAALRLQKNPSE